MDGLKRVAAINVRQHWSFRSYSKALWLGVPSGRQTDTCQGDSGGPAIATINGTEFVTGVVSGGPEGCIGLTDYSSIVDKAG